MVSSKEDLYSIYTYAFPFLLTAEMSRQSGFRVEQQVAKMPQGKEKKKENVPDNTQSSGTSLFEEKLRDKNEVLGKLLKESKEMDIF